MFNIGVDEIGTGSVISSYIVCGVRALENSPELRQMVDFKRLNDSKKLKPAERERAVKELIELRDSGIIQVVITEVSQEKIEVGYQQALIGGYLDTITSFQDQECPVILDGIVKTGLTRVQNVVKADTKIPCVMAASCIGKVFRDQLMNQIDLEFPQYNWKKNKGYLTPDHLAAIKEHGLSKYHRKSYKIGSKNEPRTQGQIL